MIILGLLGGLGTVGVFVLSGVAALVQLKQNRAVK